MSGASDHDGLYIPGISVPVSREVSDASTGKDNKWADVPWRTILAAVGIVLATYVIIVLMLAAVRILTWVAIAGFMAIVLAPLVSRLDRRLGGRRTVATGTVVVGTLVVLA